MLVDNLSNVAAAASSTASVAGSPLLEIAKTYVGYIGVLATAIVVAFAGIRKALKDLKGTDAPGSTNPGGRAASAEVQRIVGGTIMETTTILMWSESNRAVVDAIEAMVGKLDSVVNCINFSTEATRDLCRDIGELRHQIERLRDKMP